MKKNITGREITLQLQLHLVRGTLTLNMPNAPSDRIWWDPLINRSKWVLQSCFFPFRYGFRKPPQLELALRPCFGGRSLGKYESTFAAVMRRLETRLKQEFMKVAGRMQYYSCVLFYQGSKETDKPKGRNLVFIFFIVLDI